MASGSWWGGITDQITSMAKDVLQEGSEEVEDPTTVLRMEKDKTTELTNYITALKAENARLEGKVVDLNQSVEISEVQNRNINLEFKSLLQDKEEELKSLRETISELNETNQHLSTNRATQNQPHDHFSSHFKGRSHYDGDEASYRALDLGDPLEGHHDEDLSEVLSYQRQVNDLHTQLDSANAEIKHLRRQLTSSPKPKPQQTPNEGGVSQEQLQTKIWDLEAALAQAKEQHQSDLAILNEQSSTRLTELRASHQVDLEEQQEAQAQHLLMVEQYQRDLLAAQARLDEVEDEKRTLETRVSQASVKPEAQTCNDKQHQSIADERLQLQAQLHDLKAKLSQQEEEYMRKNNELKITKQEHLTILSFLEHGCKTMTKKARSEKYHLRTKLSSVSHCKDSEITELQRSLSQLEVQLQLVRSEAESYKNELVILRDDNSVLERSIDELDKDHEAALEELVNQRETLKRENLQLQEQLSTSNAFQSPAESQIRDDLHKVTISLNDLHMEKQSLENELKTAKAKLKVLADKYKQLNQAHRSSQEELASIQSEVVSLRGELTRSHEELETARGVIIETNAEIEAVKQQLDEARINGIPNQQLQAEQAQLSDLDDIKAALEMNISENRENQARLERTRYELERAQSERSQAEQQLVAVQRVLEGKEEEIERTRERCQESLEKCRELEKQLDTSYHEISTLRDNVAELQSTNSQLDEENRTKSSLQEQLEEENRTKSLLQEELEEENRTKSWLQEQLEHLRIELKVERQTKKELQVEAASLIQLSELRDEEVQKLNVKHAEVMTCLHQTKEREASLEHQLESLMSTQPESFPPQHEGISTGDETPEDEISSSPRSSRAGTLEDESYEKTGESDPTNDSNGDSREQLMELKELLAQKVLLINELQSQSYNPEPSEQVAERSVDDLESRQHLVAQNAQLLRELEVTKSSLRSSEAELEEMREQARDLEADIKVATDAQEQLMLKYEATQSDLESQNDFIDQLQAELANQREVTHKLANEKLTLDESTSHEADKLTALINELTGEKSSLQEQLNGLSLDSAVNSETVKEASFDLVKAQAEISELNSNLLKSHGQLTERLSRIEALEDELDRLHPENLKLANELSEMNESLTELTNQNETYEEALAEMKDQLDSVKIENQSLSSQLETSQLEFQEIQSRSLNNSTIQTEQSEALKDLTSQISQLKAQIDELTHKLSLKESENAGFSQELEEVQSKNATISSEQRSLRDEIHLGDSEIKRLTGYLESMEQEKELYESQMEELSNQNTSFTSRIEELIAENNSYKSRLDDSNTESITLKSEVEKLTNANLTASNHLDRLQQTLADNENEIHSLKQELNEHQANLAALEAEKSQLQATIAMQKDQLDKRNLLVTSTDDPDSWPTGDSQARDDEGMTDELKSMKKELQEKDRLIRELRESNNALKHTVNVYGDLHSLKDQVSKLEADREQLVSVLNDKTHEIANLKQEVIRLGDELANAHRRQREQTSTTDQSDREDMNKQAISRLSALVSDRELQIEALEQKNKSLLEVLQTTGSPGSSDGHQIQTLLEDKSTLTNQLQQALNDRQQLYAALEAKHKEALTYHGEAVKLNDLLQQAQLANQNLEERLSANHEIEEPQLPGDYTAPNLEAADELDSAVTLNEEVLNGDVNDKELTNLSRELKLLKHEVTQSKKATQEKEGEIQSLRNQLSARSLKEKESLQTQAREASEIQGLEQRLSILTSERNEIVRNLQSMTEQRDRIHAELGRSQTEAQHIHSQLQCLQNENQRLTSEAQALHAEHQNVLASRDKLRGDVERLTAHLMDVEQSQTEEMLLCEQREKELRDRLNSAELHLASSTEMVGQARQEQSQYINTLQSQLGAVVTERDNLSRNVNRSEEQVRQLQSQLDNLQLVLEEMEQQRDEIHATEVARLQQQLEALNSSLALCKSELRMAELKLEEQSEAVAAAGRVSEQLERKDEVINALQAEVEQRENEIRERESKIRQLVQTNETRVEKQLVRNLFLNYFSTSRSKQPEVLALVARVLTFSEEDRQRVGLGNNQGWVSGILSRFSHPTSSKQTETDQSFSEMFVQFLEAESAPKSQPLPLPVDKMIAARHPSGSGSKAQISNAPLFNPFIAPTPASTISGPTRLSRPSQGRLGGASITSANQQAHPLLIGMSSSSLQPIGRSSPLLTNSIPASSAALTTSQQTSPAIKPSIPSLVTLQTEMAANSGFVPITKPSSSGPT